MWPLTRYAPWHFLYFLPEPQAGVVATDLLAAADELGRTLYASLATNWRAFTLFHSVRVVHRGNSPLERSLRLPAENTDARNVEQFRGVPTGRDGSNAMCRSHPTARATISANSAIIRSAATPTFNKSAPL